MAAPLGPAMRQFVFSIARAYFVTFLCNLFLRQPATTK
jgi:hypothetical protein